MWSSQVLLNVLDETQLLKVCVSTELCYAIKAGKSSRCSFFTHSGSFYSKVRFLFVTLLPFMSFDLKLNKEN